MQWFFSIGDRPDNINYERVIDQTIIFYGDFDPCEAAWFRFALRQLLPQWVKEGRVK